VGVVELMGVEVEKKDLMREVVEMNETNEQVTVVHSWSKKELAEEDVHS
jgi:hypothetical protein